MKFLVSFLIGMAIFCFGFYLDGQLITWVLTQFPASAHEWLGVIKVALWIFTFSVTFGLSLLFAWTIGGFVFIFLDSKK